MQTSDRSRPLPPDREGRAVRPRALDVAAVQALTERDNVTNFAHVAFNYAVLIATIAAAIWSYGAVADAGLGWWWNVPATVLAVVIIGGTMHQFGGAIHEAGHFILFKNRKLNELASDWLVAFPLYTTTYQYRVHHLAHHQFVNDMARDPDIAQLRESGHWLDFPMPQIDFLREVARMLLPVRLIRYTLARARYSSIGFEGHAYHDEKRGGWTLTVIFGVLFAVLLLIVVGRLARWGYGEEALWLIGACWAAITGYFLAVPESAFSSTRLQPVVSHRATAIARMSYLGAGYSALVFLQMQGYPAFNYFLLLWVLPLFTTFPLFMVLLQLVQHGNADRGRYTNTRVFHVNPLLRYCIFPWGQDYHLPHHLMANVPHYNLRRLHAEMLKDPEYRQKAVELDGFFHSRRGLSIAAAMTPEHAPRTHEAIHVDNDSLRYAEVRDRAAIDREAERSAEA